jgi:hypothetical protein
MLMTCRGVNIAAAQVGFLLVGWFVFIDNDQSKVSGGNRETFISDWPGRIPSSPMFGLHRVLNDKM